MRVSGIMMNRHRRLKRYNTVCEFVTALCIVGAPFTRGSTVLLVGAIAMAIGSHALGMRFDHLANDAYWLSLAEKAEPGSSAD